MWQPDDVAEHYLCTALFTKDDEEHVLPRTSWHWGILTWGTFAIFIWELLKNAFN